MATVSFQNNDVDTSNTTSYAGTAFTPAADDLIVNLVATAGSVEPTAAGACTDDQGGTYTLVNFALRSGSASSVYIFFRNQSVASAVAHTITFTCTGDAATGCCQTVLTVAGMSRYGSSAAKQSAKTDNTGAGGTPAATFGAACDTSNPTIGVVGSSTNPVTVTEPSGWTERSDTGVGTPAQGIETVSRDSGFTGTTITWGSTTAGASGTVIVELDTSAAPSATGQGWWGAQW